MSVPPERTTIDLSDTPLPSNVPWVAGPVTVEVDEDPAAPGWSIYTLAGGSRPVLMEAIDTLPSVMLAAVVLWRVVAGTTQVCPCCSAKAELIGAADAVSAGQMAHEAACCVSDAALRESWDVLAATGPFPAGLPGVPRRWVVRPPRLP